MTIVQPDKPIHLSGHAAAYRATRGFTAADVEETIRSSPWLPARNHRLEATRDFPFAAEWNGTRYATKRLRPVFVEEADEIVVGTVYTYVF